ncbi:hypothetical protein BDV93DRAFT_499519 [Ceratobasidium sp. AG-I]|nr:hypothetical protein BDV93DRAFT_499519 [Ceratobasidium sp. AG-I]
MASSPPQTSAYAPLRAMSPPAEESRSRSRSPLFPEPQPMSQASIDDMHNTERAELVAHEQSHPPRSGAPTRGHVLPASRTHRRSGSAPDPWSPGYQRNVHRFSQPAPPTGKQPKRVSIVTPEHARSTPAPSNHAGEAHGHGARARSIPLYAHHRHGSGSSGVAVRVRKKEPSLANFFRKLNGERVRERGHKVPGVWESTKAIVTSSWLNVLFIFVPLSWIAALGKWHYTYAFILSFVAIIPLENISEFGGEQLALYCGESIGDLIVITLHNVVEAVLALILLIKCELKLLQSTVIGVVLLHCLLIPGTAFLTDGTKLWAQQLKPRVTQLNQSLLTIGVLALVVPAGFFTALPYQNPGLYAPQYMNNTLASVEGVSVNATGGNFTGLAKRAEIDYYKHKASVHAIEVAASVVHVSDATRDWMLRLSRGTSVILLIIYIGSRFYLHNPPGEHIVVEDIPLHDQEAHFTDLKHPIIYEDVTPRGSLHKRGYSLSVSGDDVEDREKLISHIEREHGASQLIDEEAEHHEPPEIGPWMAVLLLIIVIGLLSVTAEWLVKSIEPIRETELFTSEWFGLILLPLVSYAADGLNTIMFFIRTNLLAMNVPPPDDLAKAKSIDLSIQFTLFWIPALVLIGWALNEPLTLLFDHFEVVVVVGACFLVNSVTQDGRTNWSEGMIMIGFYLIIALAAWYYPGEAEPHFLLQCQSIIGLLESSPVKAASY